MNASLPGFKRSRLFAQREPKSGLVQLMGERRAAATVSDDTRAAWHFDECAGSTADDAAPSERAGELSGGADWVETPP